MHRYLIPDLQSQWCKVQPAGPWLRPRYDNLLLRIFEQLDGATNVTVDSSGQSPKTVSSSMRVDTPKRALPMSYNMH